MVAVVFFGVGYFTSASGIFAFLSGVSQNTFQAGWDAAKKRLVETGFAGPIRADMEVKNISGEIQKIDGNKITLKIHPLEPLADPSLDTRIVVVDSATKIYGVAAKDPKEYAAEVKAYEKNRKPADPITLPDSFKKIEISVSDLKAGDVISVIAEKDIKEAKEFAALEINLNKPAAPIVAPAPL